MTDTWTAITTTGAPSAHSSYTAVWTGSKMIVWSGYNDSDFYNEGGQYDPESDTWTPMTTTGAPSARGGHTAVWTGSRMIVWGGRDSAAYSNDRWTVRPGDGHLDGDDDNGRAGRHASAIRPSGPGRR